MKLSIVTPNYNYDKFISATLESVLNQDYQNVEHIIIDDGSTDNSVNIIKEFQRKYPERIKLVEQSNKGQTAAINEGLKIATGDIIGWINSDDTYCSNVFNEIMQMFQQSNIDLVYGDANVVDLEGTYIYRLRTLRFCYTESIFIGFGNSLISNAVFWRKEIMDQVGLMDENLRCNMDGDYFSKLTYGRKLRKIDSPLANYRRQTATIESLKHEDWSLVVSSEQESTQRNSYSKLFISKYLTFEQARIIKWVFILLRAVRRAIYLHYIFSSLSKLRYLLKEYFSRGNRNILDNFLRVK